jgi:uncharacterized protein (DUF488 family)
LAADSASGLDSFAAGATQAGGSLGGRSALSAPLLFTIGHSTRSLAEFVSILTGFGVRQVMDIRTIPRSRHNPQYDQASLEPALRHAGFNYRHMKGLGGLRHPLADSPNRGWRNDSFRGFADYMKTDVFRAALAELITAASEQTTVIMCAEAVPWRCHRSLIADALVARGHSVEHIMGEGVTRRHALNPMAVVTEEDIVYPSPQPELSGL